MFVCSVSFFDRLGFLSVSSALSRSHAIYANNTDKNRHRRLPVPPSDQHSCSLGSLDVLHSPVSSYELFFYPAPLPMPPFPRNPIARVICLRSIAKYIATNSREPKQHRSHTCFYICKWKLPSPPSAFEPSFPNRTSYDRMPSGIYDWAVCLRGCVCLMSTLAFYYLGLYCHHICYMGFKGIGLEWALRACFCRDSSYDPKTPYCFFFPFLDNSPLFPFRSF